MLYYDYIDVPVQEMPKLLAVATDKGISDIILFPKAIPKDATHNPQKFVTLGHQLSEYFKHQRQEFTVPLDIQGTEFQKKIWGLLQKIPYGEMLSYKTLAGQANSAPRAVGGANKRNRLPIIIPCHRIIQHNGQLGGYMGATQNDQSTSINFKRLLLQLEGAKISA